MNLTPAYGRDYKNKRSIIADLKANLDFIIRDITSRWDGKPINLSQLKENNIHTVYVYYNRARKVTSVTIADLKKP